MIFGFKKENPATNNTGKKLRVNKSRCPQNHLCPAVKVCPKGALIQSGFKAPVVDQDKCISCGKCVRFCPMKALTLE